MKGIVRAIVFNSLILFIMSQAFSGFQVNGGLQTLIAGGITLSIVTFFLRPILSVLAFPFNVITFGSFNIVINAIILFALTLFVRQISVHAFIWPGITFAGFIVPKIHFNLFFAFLFLSIVYSFMKGVLTWFVDK
jgi:uncharacterized membrane protein YvlD (DUF360 family)